MAKKEYIERGDIEKWLLTETASLDGEEDKKCVVERLRNDIPAADVVEVRHAKFMPTKNFSGLKCSACGARVKNGAWRTHNWCYACGAKMDGGADDGKAD